MNAEPDDAAQNPHDDRTSAAGVPSHGDDPVLVRLNLLFRRFDNAPQDDFFRAVVTAYRMQEPT